MNSNLTCFCWGSVLVIAALGCKKNSTEPGHDKTHLSGAAPQLTEIQTSIKGITESETLIQSLSARKGILEERFTNFATDPLLFADSQISYLGIQTHDLIDLLADAKKTDDSCPLTDSFSWPIAEAEMAIPFERVWSPILDSYRFEDAQFGVLKGSFLGPDEFEMETKFEGRLQLGGDKLCGVRGYQTLVWRELRDGDWKIVSWKQSKLQFTVSEQPIFKNVTASAIPDDETRNTVSLSSHEEMIVTRCDELETAFDKWNKNGRRSKRQRDEIYAGFEVRAQYKGCNDWTSVGQYPSVSTVDYDQDGLDDLFITDRWQPPQLLRNQGDGTFEDTTKQSGIDVPEMVTCGYFFDYDNDGDADLFLGLSLVPSLFFENVDGEFRRHAEINQVLEETRFVNAISVADINRDGLLDLYLSTYATGTGPIDDWIGLITRQQDQLKTRLKIERADKFVDRGGPPNIVLMNRGATFDWVKIGDELKQFRGSYQSSWNDYDDDGDLDLYVCNDFSPDVFLRNDTVRGSFDLKFTDVTQDVVPTMDMGFGMGCSWGDFDNDADLDLYVSNMYSKAGNRIVDQVEGSDPRLKVAAHGNFLFENIGGKFKQVAGDEAGQQRVARVGWSYGGQFADFDNDGKLDIYVPSGCYSAPEKVKTKVDL